MKRGYRRSNLSGVRRSATGARPRGERRSARWSLLKRLPLWPVRSAGSRLVIAGGAVRGNLYGVYGFLEEQLGCRWFTPTVSRIPKTERVAIESLDVTKVPALEYREVMLF